MQINNSVKRNSNENVLELNLKKKFNAVNKLKTSWRHCSLDSTKLNYLCFIFNFSIVSINSVKNYHLLTSYVTVRYV